MWRKALIAVVCLLSSLSVAYVYSKDNNNNLSASTNKYNVGGTVTGRVNMAPNGITGDHIGLQAGDHVMIGGNNPYTGNPLSFQLLLYDENYTDYNNTDVINEVRDPISSWLTASDEVICDDFSTLADEPNLNALVDTDVNGVSRYVYSNYKDTVLGTKEAEFSNYLSGVVESQIIAPRDLSPLRYIGYEYVVTNVNDGLILQKQARNLLKNAKEFVSFSLFYPNPVLGSQNNSIYSGKLHPLQSKFSKVFYLSSGGTKSVNSLGTAAISATAICAEDGTGSINGSEKGSIRPYLHLDLSEIVFSVSNPVASGIRSNVDDTFILGGGVYYTQGGASMKLRIHDPNMEVTFEKIMTKNGKVITQIPTGVPAYFNASGTEGENHTISALIFDSENHLIGYQPLDDAKADLSAYKFDTTGLIEGTYKIALVNEVYTGLDPDPTHSSTLTNVQTLEITDPDFKVIPKEDLEYQKNVSQGDVTADIIVKDGVSYGSFRLISDSDTAGHANDYQLFDIDGKTITVKSTSGLDAGEYYFKLEVLDDSGSPLPGIDPISVCIEVAKKDLTVAFNNPSVTKKSIADAATAWNETATATPNIGTKVTYSVSKGTNLISIDSNTGAVTYKGNGVFGKATIKATADDSGAAKDNYNPAYAEKEIIIYRGVNGKFSPDSASESTTNPIFTSNQTNVQVNGVIGKAVGSEGTPDEIDGTDITYHYSLVAGEDSGSFTIDESTGVVKANEKLGVGTYEFTAKVKDNWSEKTIKVTVTVKEEAAEVLKFYENSASNIAITSKTVKATDTNVSVFATVKGSTNTNPVTYKIKDGSTNVITINSDNGSVVIKGVGTVIIVAEKQGAAGQANASAELTFTVTSGEQEFIYTDSGGNELPKLNDKYKAYEEVYAKNKTFQLYTAGNPAGSTVTYRLKSGSPSDVISVDSNGLVHILNASLNTQMGKVIVEATSHDPSGNYSDKTIELPINIKKADQTISFADVTYAVNGKGKVTPVINEQDISGNDGGVTVNDTDYYITIDSSISTSIAWTNNGVDIEYNYTGNGIDIPLHVEKVGNRNYNKAEATGSMHIMGPDENTLAINRPGKIVYGDHFTIKSLQDDSSSTNVKYTFEVDNTTYVSSPTVSGNKAEFEAIRYSGSTSISIKVTRTADGETTLSKTVTIQVLPKEIEIVIDNKTKNKGEQNPALTYQDFRNDLVSWNGVKDVIQENDIKLSTTAKTDSNAGAYPITGDSNFLNKTYPNYSFKFKDGTLTINEDNIQDDWYHLELDDGKNTIYKGEWTNKDVNIISDHNEYVNMSLDQSTWKPSYVTVTKEGETNQSFWMKKDNGTITKAKKEIIRIDKTAPRVKSIKGKDTTNKLQNIMNQLSLKVFFRPGTSFEINTDDSKDDLKVSGTKEIAYKVFKLEKRTRAGEELVKEGTLKVTNEKASIVISDSAGVYKLCVIPTDNAENTNTESCHEIEIKKIDVDVDGDGKPDFNDPDGDGCPDLNIVLGKDDDGFTIKLNIDNNGDGVPELNIDTNGDGLPDINVDTDDDGKPDLNIATNIKWNPTHCVTGQIEEYCTDLTIIPDLNIDLDGDGRPDINIDLDGDGIPDIDIDTDGDGKPDINIDTDKDGKPDENIKDITEWKPGDRFTVNGKDFNTMTGLEPDPEKPDNLDKPNHPTKDDDDSDVKGSYYPGKDVGGAMTGDSTNVMLYICLIVCSIGAITYLIYKNRKIHFNK